MSGISGRSGFKRHYACTRVHRSRSSMYHERLKEKQDFMNDKNLGNHTKELEIIAKPIKLS